MKQEYYYLSFILFTDLTVRSLFTVAASCVLGMSRESAASCIPRVHNQI